MNKSKHSEIKENQIQWINNWGKKQPRESQDHFTEFRLKLTTVRVQLCPAQR